ncbi:MAG: sugar-binding protein [Victivallaceae bacterium]
MTHEVSLAKPKAGQDKAAAQTEAQRPIKITAEPANSVKINNAVARVNPNINKTVAQDVPVRANLPKTETPSIFLTDKIPDWNQAGGGLFPPLRKHDGALWDKEKTEIKVNTDGNKLYILCRVYDKTPVDAIISNSRKQGSKKIWEDDSIELFIMRDVRSEYYCQYIVSVSGMGQAFYHSDLGKINTSKSTALPKNFEHPQFNVEEFDGGFEFEIKIPLSNVKVNSLKPGDSLLMQIVRNYRGQSGKKSVVLQLFPTHIYGDSRAGVNNTDRRAFQPVLVRGK